MDTFIVELTELPIAMEILKYELSFKNYEFIYAGNDFRGARMYNRLLLIMRMKPYLKTGTCIEVQNN